MQTLLHLASKLILLAVTAGLFTLFIVHRPGASNPPTKRAIISLLVIGGAIGIVFLITQSMYVQPPSV